jgi:ferrochelatase
MTTGIILLNFGEPASPERDLVVDYLERIFQSNTAIDDQMGENAREDPRVLAKRRAPGLLSEYEAIGGSPLNRQVAEQATGLESVLRERGFDDVETYVGMQFTEPSIAGAVTQAQTDGVDTVVGLPTYPLCGPSTTVAALAELSTAIEEIGWDVDVVNITGWHRHPTYLRMRVDGIRTFLKEQGIHLGERTTELVYSAHGTPQHFVDNGSRYVDYVHEWCELCSSLLGIETYTLGYQNHENRDAAWTEPAIEEIIPTIDAERIVVEPISFVHEHSETLWELDEEMCEVATDNGLEFFRVPIPHDDERFSSVLADLIEPTLARIDPGLYHLRPCTCTDRLDALCLNCLPKYC